MAKNPLEPIPPPAGSADSPNGPVVNVKRTDDFYLWPTLSTLPQSTISQIKSNRNGVKLKKFNPVPAKNGALGGYSYIGVHSKPAKVIPDWVNGEKNAEILKKKQEVLQRFHDVELGGEGYTSAVMTGDGAGFSWGSGLAHGGSLEPWVSQAYKLAKGSLFKNRMLDFGFFLDGQTWKIVDTDAGVTLEGEAAINFIQGHDSAGKDTKQRILSSFAEVAEEVENGSLAAEAQWTCLVNSCFKSALVGDTKEGGQIFSKWAAEAICYVMHCSMWGNFAGWAAFAKTGGDLRSILRMEVDATKFYKDMGTYWVVPAEFGKNVTPAATMLNNMGAGCMLGVLWPWDDLPRDNDVVFELSGGTKSVLRGIGPYMLKDDELYAFVSKVNKDSMDDLLKAAAGLKTKLKKLREQYNVKDSNRTVANYGYRVQVAMDAVLAKGIATAKDRQSAIESVYLDNEYKILPVDQQEVIRKYLKGTAWDVWDSGNESGFIAQIQGYSMSALLSTLEARNYATVDKVRQAYESEGKPFGWRPWIAMMAVLNRGGGSAAGWIVTHAGYKGPPKPLPRDQRRLIRQTIGLPAGDADLEAEGIEE